MSIESSNRWPNAAASRKWWFALAALPALSCANGVDANVSEAMNATTVPEAAAARADALTAATTVPGQGLAGGDASPPSTPSSVVSAVPVAEAAAPLNAPEAAAPVNAPEASAPVSVAEAAAPVSVAEAAAAPGPADAALAAAAATAAKVARPPTNTGTGFFALNGKIYDANGVEFRIRGFNHTHWWGSNETEAIPFMKRANANTVRAVFGPGQSDAPTPAARQAVVEQYIAQGIVPMVDYHNATCDENPASVAAAVDFWLGPDKAWLQSHEREVMLNITNEWGPNSSVWRDAYKTAVARIRAAGVKNMLVIDAGGACGQNAESIENWGREVFDSDPEKNVVFSIHMYGYWKDPGDPQVGSWDGKQPYDIDGELTKLQATGVPIIVGEFSWDAFNQVTYTTKAALAAYEKHGVGWLAWMWFNPGGDVTVDVAKSNSYTQSSDLTDFGHLLVEDPNVGLLAKAKPATIF